MQQTLRGFMAATGVLAALFLAPLAQAAGADRTVAVDKVRVATEVLREIMGSADKGIPRELLRKAAAVAIFPNVLKAGLILGGKSGRGVILRHDPTTQRWSAPAFYAISSASVGWQIGAKSTDLILIIRRQQGVDSLLAHELTLGSDVSVTAGPVGNLVHASNDVALKSGALAYSHSRGLFVGAALEGTKIEALPDYNRAYYGRSVSARQILFGDAMPTLPDSALTLIEQLSRYSR